MANLVLRTIKQSPLTIEELDQNFANLNEQFSDLDASNLSQGTVALSRLGVGTPDETKYLRGDNTWQVVPIIPDQSDNQLSFLQTDGESLLWTPIIPSPILPGTEYKSSLGGTENVVTRILGDTAPNSDIYITNATVTSNTAYDTLQADETTDPLPPVLQGQTNPVLEIGSLLIGSGVDVDGTVVIGTTPKVYTYDRLPGLELLNDYALGIAESRVWPKNVDQLFNINVPHVAVNLRQFRFVAQTGSNKINAKLSSQEAPTNSPTLLGVYGIYPEVGDKIICDAFPDGAIVTHAVYGSPDIIKVDVPSTQSGVFYGTVVSPHSSILSGSNNFAIGNAALIANGDNNIALGAKTTVVNGSNNIVNTPYSTIISGKFNAISQPGSTIVSGTHNKIYYIKVPTSTTGIDPASGGSTGVGDGIAAFVGIGNHNTLIGNSLVLKGDSNQIQPLTSGNHAILNGSTNIVFDNGSSTIVYGSNNTIGKVDTTETRKTIILSGSSNQINASSTVPNYSTGSNNINGYTSDKVNKVVSGEANVINGSHNTITVGNNNTITGHYVDLLYGYNNTVTPVDATSRPIINGAYESSITEGIALHGWNMIVNTTNQRVESMIPQSTLGWKPNLNYSNIENFGSWLGVAGGSQKSTYLQATTTYTGRQTKKLSGYVSSLNATDTDETLKRGFIKLRQNTSYFITGKVIARRSYDGKTKAWDVKVLVTRDITTNSARIVGSASYTVFAQDSGTEGWAITGSISTVSGDSVFTIQADRSSTANSNTEKWFMSLEALEVALD